MMTVSDAVRLLVLTAGGSEHTNERYHRDQCVRLAMQWPSLAAALADLLAAHDVPIPPSFRSARAAMHGMAADPGIDAAERAVQPLENGAWCFCSGGPNADGRGHLRGEAGCNDSLCPRGCVPYPHQHDGTMPGSPVIPDA
jgi:hypothetical protein